MHRLDLVGPQGFGEHWSLRLKVTNLLDWPIRETTGDEVSPESREGWSVGRTVGLEPLVGAEPEGGGAQGRDRVPVGLPLARRRRRYMLVARLLREVGIKGVTCRFVPLSMVTSARCSGSSSFPPSSQAGAGHGSRSDQSWLTRVHFDMKLMHLCFLFCALAFNGDAVGNEQLCAQQTWSMTLESVTTESGDPSEDAVLWDGIANLGFWAGNDGLNLDNGYLSSARTDSVQFNLMGMDISDTGGAP